MKWIISLKNIASIKFDIDDDGILLEIYHDRDGYIKHTQRLAGHNAKTKDFFITKYEGIYAQIKNALTNKEDFVEVEV